jgi:hypothetical protein
MIVMLSASPSFQISNHLTDFHETCSVHYAMLLEATPASYFWFPATGNNSVLCATVPLTQAEAGWLSFPWSLCLMSCCFRGVGVVRLLWGADDYGKYLHVKIYTLRWRSPYLVTGLRDPIFRNNILYLGILRWSKTLNHFTVSTQ